MKEKFKIDQIKEYLKQIKIAPIGGKNTQNINDENILTAQRFVFTGSLLYLIGLFLPYYVLIDELRFSFQVLLLGGLYLLMISVVVIVCLVGVIRNRNYLRWVIPNAIFCTIEIIYRIVVMHFKIIFSFPEFIGSGYVFIYFGTLITWIGLINYFIIMDRNKRLKEMKAEWLRRHGGTG